MSEFNPNDPKYDTYVMDEESKQLRNEELSRRADVHSGFDKRIGKSTDTLGRHTHDAEMKRMYLRTQKFGRASCEVQDGPFMRLGYRIDTRVYTLLNRWRDRINRWLDRY